MNKKGMKNWKAGIIGLALCASSTVAMAAPQLLNKVAAVVNNGVVLESDVDGLMRSVKLNAQAARQQLPDDRTLRNQIIERLIMDTIILQTGQKMGLQISDEQLNQAIQNIARQNNMSLETLRQRLAADGMDYATYRDQIRKEIMISEVRNNEVRRRVTILPQEVDLLARQLANQNSQNTELNLSHILIPLAENPSQAQVDEAEKLANKIAEEARNGADFGRLAVTYSADPQALKGGAMGWSRLQELPSLFATALTTAKKGSIVGPLRSGVGFHILRVNELRGQHAPVSVTEVHARHILMRVTPLQDDQQTRAKLDEIRSQIQNGTLTFAAAARRYSQDPGSAPKGGDLGWSMPEMYDPAFREALLQLPKGQISQPVRSAYGWHLIELLGTRQTDRTDMAQKDQAWRLLFNRKFAEETQTWMQELRAGAYVKILDGDAQRPAAQ